VVQVLNFGSELDIYSLSGAKPRTEQLPSSPQGTGGDGSESGRGLERACG
jgi:hypothetical protein